MSATPRTALVTGVTGQDGSYLAELLLTKGYRVVGLARGAAAPSEDHLRHLDERVERRVADVRDAAAVDAVLADVEPDEVYHLAAQSVVHASWGEPTLTAEVTALGAMRVLDAARRLAPRARILMASSSEIFGRPADGALPETQVIRPATPYGAAKAFAYWMTATYREVHGVHASSAILFNHESPRRSTDFVTRKISLGVARIAAGQAHELRLGNLAARRDWGFAGDYVDAMWRMVQEEAPGDLVIGTGVAHSVEDFCRIAFAVVGLDYRNHVVTDPAFHRPVDATTVVADARLARARIGWAPTRSFEALVHEMVEADLARVRAGVL